MVHPQVRPGWLAQPAGWTMVEGVCVGIVAFFVPLLAPLAVSGSLTTELPGTWISQSASLVAAILAFIMFRRVTAYPGARGFAYMLPAYSTTFGIAAALLLASRASYSGTMLLVGYVASIGTTFVLGHARRSTQLHMYFIPNGKTGIVSDTPGIDWITLQEPILPPGTTPIVADLRANHGSDWERMLAEAAISGRAVYHTKQLRESLTGRVDIEHLSENSFGSLVPNLAYRGVKRGVDILACLIAIPILIVPMLIVALAIRLDSAGSPMFVQERMGYQGKPFRVIKFRTMAVAGADDDDATSRFITQSEDARVTKVGRFLRRSRIDELPQILNVLRGEMSWIGPRPEAISLSRWYESELPFYRYRHIVRPGITGWAQVNQGHVAQLDEVLEKLHFDFYYIKYFSAWLDILIALRTVGIIFSGIGAK